MNINEFTDSYFLPLLSKIYQQNKQIFLSGDFNINLLNYNSDESTSTFLNNLTANLFIPHITIPTRLTSHSKNTY